VTDYITAEWFIILIDIDSKTIGYILGILKAELPRPKFLQNQSFRRIKTLIIFAEKKNIFS